MIPWEHLTVALDELDSIRAQVRESRIQERTSRFYSLIRIRQIGSEHGGHVASVIELSGGWVIVHWTHDPKSVGMYSSISSARRALCADGVYLLALEDEFKRLTHGTVASELSDAELKVLTALRRGLSNTEIAAVAGLREQTVKNVLSRVYRKLGVQDRLQAALLARDLDVAGTQDTDNVSSDPADHGVMVGR